MILNYSIAFRQLGSSESVDRSGHTLVHFILPTELNRSSISHHQVTSTILAFSYFANEVVVNITCIQELIWFYFKVEQEAYV
jgi:hypothetical protein